MTLTAVSVLRIRRPRPFLAAAAAMVLLASCGSGESETTADRGVAPIEHAEDAGAPVVVESESGLDSIEREREIAARPPATSEVPAPEPNGNAANGHRDRDPVADAAPAVAPSPPPRPSPVADAPPPVPPEEPPLSREQAIERASRPPVGDEVRSLVACGDVADAYERLMTDNRSCTRDEDCRVVEGACSIGLGGCWYPVNASVGYDDADRLAARYRELACNGPVCRCAAPPERAVCDQGVCAAG